MKNLIKCFQISCALFLTSMSILTMAMDSGMGDKQRKAKTTIQTDDLTSSSNDANSAYTDATDNVLLDAKNGGVTSDQFTKTNYINLQQQEHADEKNMKKLQQQVDCLEQQLCAKEKNIKYLEQKIHVIEEVIAIVAPKYFSAVKQDRYKKDNDNLFTALGLNNNKPLIAVKQDRYKKDNDNLCTTLGWNHIKL